VASIGGPFSNPCLAEAARSEALRPFYKTHGAIRADPSALEAATRWAGAAPSRWRATLDGCGKRGFWQRAEAAGSGR